jgi:transposase
LRNGRSWRAPKGCEGQFVTAPLPLRVLPKSVASESLIAHVCVSKVLDRQPLYHLEKSMEQRFNWKVGRNLMANWMIAVADQLQPLINLMKDHIEGYDIAAIDATSFHVLNEPGRASQTKSYAYCIRGGPPDKRVILYEYNAYNHKQYVDETLAHFKGIIQCDASPVFNQIGAKDTVALSYCHAHARRKFEQIEKAAKKGKAQLASEAMRIYGQLYVIERHATDLNMTSEQRHSLRQEKSRPIMDYFYQWLTINRDKTLPKSPIGQAISYCLTHWDGLLIYLTDGRIEIDNNSTERDIKPFVIARKNFLFACTTQGADSLGVHFSLILTARLHGLNPTSYYTEMLTRLPYCVTPKDYDGLLPWNFI